MDLLQSSPSNYTSLTTGSQSEADILISMEYDDNTVDLKSSNEDIPHDPLIQVASTSEGSDAALCAFAVPDNTGAASTHQAFDSGTTAILTYHSSETLKDLTRVIKEHSGGSGLVIQNIIGSSLSTSAHLDW
jgi:tripartite-type tricarboxylate transporter receptor subunit TctC